MDEKDMHKNNRIKRILLTKESEASSNHPAF